jgi:hypothetical protein
MHGEGRGHDAESGVTYAGEYALGRALAVPSSMEVALAPAAVIDGGEPAGVKGAAAATAEGLAMGTVGAPLVVVAGEAIPSGVVSVRVRLPWRPTPAPPPPVAGEEEVMAGEEDTGSCIGEIASHETGRSLRCSLHVGLPEQPAPEPVAASGSADVHATTAAVAAAKPGIETVLPPLVYGTEAALAEGSVAVVLTSEGVAAVEGVVIASATEPGTYTLRIVDATPGRYGALGRCPEVSVVLEVVVEAREAGGIAADAVEVTKRR